MRLGTNTEILLDSIYKELLKISQAIVPAPQEKAEPEEIKVEISVEDIQPEQPKKAAPKKKK